MTEFEAMIMSMKKGWKAEIPDGYRKLEPAEITKAGDIVWVSATKQWANVIFTGKQVGKRPTVIRQIEHNQGKEFGSW